MFHSEQAPWHRLDDLYLRVRNRINWIITKLTGNSPLSLPNAVAKPIKSLTQYGLCTQASTPTLADPVLIKCNNGVLKLVDDELPVGFKRLASIKFDGDFWYETGEVMTGDDDVTMTLDDTSTSGQNVFGSYNGTSSETKNFSLYLYGNGSSSNCYLRYGGQLLRPRFGSGERTITFGKSGTSGFSVDVTAEPDTFTTVAAAYIGMLPNSSSPAYTGSIIGNILVGTRLKWIPCERESDGVVGYYEAVKSVFLEPVGTGAPVKGAYDFSLSHIEAVGTPEVLTVSGVNLLNTATNITGYFINSSGVINKDNGTPVSQYTDLIPVETGKNYTLSLISNRSSSGNNRVHGYDSNGNWVQEINHATPTTGPDVPFTLTGTIPSGIAYVRISYGINDVEAMYEEGSTPTDYQPYVEPQTASVPMLLSVGDVKDEVELIHGPLTRRVTACLYDGTQPVGDVYMSTTGGKDAGAIIVYPLATPTTEHITGQNLVTNEGTNTVSVTANVSPIQLEVEYAAKRV